MLFTWAFRKSTATRSRLLMAVFCAVTFPMLGGIGCHRAEPQPQSISQIGAEDFRESTGVDLPAGTECLEAKTITVAFVGDTYYLKIAAGKGFLDFLRANFTSESWEIAQRYLVPPDDWIAKLPFWDHAEIERANVYYSKITNSSEGEILFHSAVAFNEATGIAYFVGTQCR